LQLAIDSLHPLLATECTFDSAISYLFTVFHVYSVQALNIENSGGQAVHNWWTVFFESSIDDVVVTVLNRDLGFHVASGPCLFVGPLVRLEIGVLDDESVHNIALVVYIDPEVCTAL
jgi:hypothetical protein